MLPCGVRATSYADDRAIIRTRLQWGLLIIFLIWLFTLPLYASDYFLNLGILIFVTLIAILGLNIVTGYCGQINIGQSALMGIGAYISAIISIHLNMPFWVSLPCAVIGSGIIGAILGIPAMRMKGFSLALVTIAVQYIFNFVIFHFPDLTGGVNGLQVPPPKIGDFVFKSEQSFYFIALILAVIGVYVAVNLLRSRVGRAFIAIRDNDLAAEVMGINVGYYKVIAFTICSMYAGVAGSLYAHYFSVLSADYFTLMNSVWYLGAAVIGGMGTITGAIFGTVFVRLIFELSDVLNEFLVHVLPDMPTTLVAATSVMAMGLVIAIFLIYEPRGLANRWAHFKSSYRLHPFSD